MKNVLLVLFSLFFSCQLNAQLNTGDLKKMINKSTKLIEKGNTSIEVYNTRAICYFDLKEYDKSELDLKNILVIDSENVSAMMLLGDLFSKKRNFKLANFIMKKLLIMVEN